MPPPRFWIAEDLQARWLRPDGTQMNLTAVHRWINDDHAKDGYPPFPKPFRTIGRIRCWQPSRVEAWEKKVRELGLPLPGQRPRGRAPGK